MVADFAFEVLIFGLEVIDQVLLLKDLQKVLGVVEVGQVLDGFVDVHLETFQLVESLVRKILGRWAVVLHAFKIRDDLARVGFLLVDDLLEHVKLVVYFLGDLIFQALLVEDSLLHISALVQIIGAH